MCAAPMDVVVYTATQSTPPRTTRKRPRDPFEAKQIALQEKFCSPATKRTPQLPKRAKIVRRRPSAASRSIFSTKNKNATELLLDHIDEALHISTDTGVQRERSDASQIRDWIVELQNQYLDEDHLEAELGILLVYLGIYKEGYIPQEDSLIAHRAADMQDQLSALTENLDPSTLSDTDKTVVNSARTHYILQAFSRLVFSQWGLFNPGGVKAIRILLSDPHHKLSCHLTEQHTDHILQICAVMQEDRMVQRLLSMDLAVDSTMVDLVRTELKWPGDLTRIDSYYAKIACVQALFFDIRQHKPNCFSVATTQFLCENFTFQTIRRLFTFLSEGYMTVEGKIVPLQPLVDPRLEGEGNIYWQMSGSVVREITAFRELLKHYGIDPTRYTPLPDESCSLEEYMGRCADAPLSPHDSRELARHFFAFKRSPLATLLIVAGEFANECRSGYSAHQLEKIATYLTRDLHFSAETLADQFRKMIWFERNAEEDLVIGETWIEYGSRINRKRLTNLDPTSRPSIISALKKATWIFTFQDGIHQRVTTLTDFQALVANCVCRAVPEDMREAILDRVRGTAFRNHLAQSCSALFADEGMEIDSRIFTDADILMLPQRGGTVEDTLDVYLPPGKRELEEKKVTGGRMPVLTLASLVVELSGINFQHDVHCPLARAYDHVFRLTPHTVPLLISSEKLTKEKASKRVSQVIGEIARQAHDFGTQPAPQWAINTIKNLPQGDSLRDDATYADIREYTYRMVLSAEQKLTVNDLFWKLSIDFLNLTPLLDQFGLINSLRDVEAYFRKKNIAVDTPRYLHMVAREFSQCFRELGIANIREHELVEAICRQTHHPVPLYVGDMGWTSLDTERPDHALMTLRINPFSNLLEFCALVGDRILPLNDRHYANFTVILPRTVTPMLMRV